MRRQKVLYVSNQTGDNIKYEKPELIEIDLLDETARGYSEPGPPDGGNRSDGSNRSDRGDGGTEPLPL